MKRQRPSPTMWHRQAYQGYLILVANPITDFEPFMGRVVKDAVEISAGPIRADSIEEAVRIVIRALDSNSIGGKKC